MKRLALASLLLVALAAVPAGSATYYVKQAGAGTQSGADSTANVMGIWTFNRNAVAGDVALLLGNFTSPPMPFSSGTPVSPIMYRSCYANRKAVVFTTDSLVMNQHSYYADSNVTWRDFTLNGSLGLVGYTHGTWANTNAGGITQGRFKLRNLAVNGNLTLDNVQNCSVESLTVYQTAATTRVFMVGTDNILTGQRDTTAICWRDTVNYCSVTATAAEGTGSTALFLFGGYDNVFTRNRFIATTSAVSSTTLRFGRVHATRRGYMTDCYFRGVNNQSAGGTDEPMAWAFKDGVMGFKMYRDTIISQGNASVASPTSPMILFAQDEGGADQAIGGNSIKYCYVRNETDATWGIGWTYGGFDGDSIIGNTFIAKNGAIESRYDRGDAFSTGNTIVDHNLFVTFAHDYSLWMDDAAGNTGVTFTNNIFYNPTLVAADTSSKRLVNFGRAADWGTSAIGPISNNYNLGWTPALNNRKAVKWSGGTSAFGVDPWKTARAPALLDVNSVYGPCIFTDSTLAAFDAHPLAGSTALSFGPDGYVGPFNVTGVTTWTIAASAGSNGSISPSGAVVVADHASQAFSIAPVAHYHITDVLADGASVGAVSSYTFSTVTANHTIAASFALTTHTITATAGPHGSISPSGATTVADGASQAYTITPATGYHVLATTVDGGSAGTATSYTFSTVATDHSISATFAADDVIAPPPPTTTDLPPKTCKCLLVHP